MASITRSRRELVVTERQGFLTKSSKTGETIEGRVDNNIDVLRNSLGSPLISAGSGNFNDMIGGQANSVGLARNDFDSMSIDCGLPKSTRMYRTDDIAQTGVNGLRTHLSELTDRVDIYRNCVAAYLSDTIDSFEMRRYNDKIACVHPQPQSQQKYTYSSILSDLQSVASAIGSGGLTDAQLNSLKTYASEVSAQLGKSSCLAYVTNALVNGNAANVDWTGGQNTSSKLGDLAPGSSQLQFNELIDKWFLGSDNPSLSGLGGSYANVTHPLFGTSGAPTANDVNQGRVGDCYLMAALACVAQDEPSKIASMFTSDGNGVYGVRFFDGPGNPVYVTVNDAVAQNAAENSCDSWVQILEKAFVEYQHMNGLANQYKAIDGGCDIGLTAVTGRQAESYECSSFSQTSWDDTVKQSIISGLNNKTEVMYGCSQNTTDPSGQIELVNEHMFSVLGYDQSTGDFILRNPWGNHNGNNRYDTQFEVSADQLWNKGGGGEVIISDPESNCVAKSTSGGTLGSQVNSLVASMSALHFQSSEWGAAYTRLHSVDQQINTTHIA
ncbi:C2 family cysteine protease [Paraburkholderia sp. BR10872]|uniref:C2 family cysteine protease n=1 Tax=Paraburkholderia sp. BR10872 TaxID=3236989 RepID=UPI0034D36F40